MPIVSSGEGVNRTARAARLKTVGRCCTHVKIMIFRRDKSWFFWIQLENTNCHKKSMLEHQKHQVEISRIMGKSRRKIMISVWNPHYTDPDFPNVSKRRSKELLNCQPGPASSRIDTHHTTLCGSTATQRFPTSHVELTFQSLPPKFPVSCHLNFQFC